MELEFALGQLTAYLKKQGYPVSKSFISYYSADFKAMVNCGPEPISRAIMIYLHDLEYNSQTKEHSLQIVFARGVKADLDTEKAEAELQTEEAGMVQRNKERSIGFIIDKVTEWRRLYNGFLDENQEIERMSLE